ncbi:motility associated factor glycosyltransferase family protein [Sulfuricystis thermophila]|uniref:motility associated factor glycosyltransferase family protein n=1 Tax=Sulfuricystis thermophila TaxID=2496847 RepID=UPI00103556B4|nr:6-hydroxymethylpterin diphosphokinase MptE-like protein [Sulfuricystis thermophila]
MTPLQQAYLTKLHATAAANLEFFKLNMPQIYQRIVAASPLPTLDISDQGDLALRYPDGTMKPVTPYYVAQEARFAEFADLKTRPQLLAFHNLRAVSEQPSYGDMQRYHYSNLDVEFRNRVCRHFVEHYPDATGLNRYPVFGSAKGIPLLLVLGSGLGGHLDRLVLEYDVRYLVVMETDEDAFRVSLFFQDYVQLSRLAMEKGTDLAFILGPDIEHITRGLMGMLRQSLPPFIVHGAALFYAMPEGERLEAIKTSVTDTLWQMFFGLGYFDDELIGIRHTFRNLEKQWPAYLATRVVDEEAVAFIIGSGPSLDGLLPLLEKYHDRAVLISCGTALGPLAHAGIVPDFHVEKERPGIVYEVITRTVPEAFRKQVHLLGLNVVMPEVFDLFGEGTVVIKEADTMGNLLRQRAGIAAPALDTQPTVSNMAMSLALSLGFKRIYLFGVDMGYRDTERHHSRHTAYLGKLPEAEHLKRLLSKRPTQEKTVPANFGGEAHTNNILEVSRLHLEVALLAHPGVRVFNLNDGVAIEGAMPLLPEQMALDATVEKWQVLEQIRSSRRHLAIDPEKLAAMLLEEIDDFISPLREIVSRPRFTRHDVIDTIIEIYRYVHGQIGKTAASDLYRGLILMLLSLTYNAISLIADEDEAVAKAEFDFLNLLDALETGRAKVLENLPG